MRDYIWNISGRTDVSDLVKKHLIIHGYGFTIEKEEGEWDEEW